MKRLLPGIAVMLLIMTGCAKEPLDNLSSDEARLYITNRNDSVSFSSYGTFRITDSVAVISNNQLQEYARTAYDAQLIEAVANQLTQKGYTRVQAGTTPDIGITINRVYNDYSGVISYPDYWGGFGGYWDPFYWGYPGYGYYFPGIIGTYTVTDGAVSIDMFDVKNAAANNNLRFVWNGLIRGSGTFVQGNINSSVQALFDQSPYLTRN
ncbi:DUF4136 domain-containing protein [Terrimonas sp. NA20]|uniref:DUF4136 domain-containing protein n=1 Tax=Terrimonas ginsenosidimutans TaxID=2908004 RepID=A0ABS9KT49_9BACT|nr:DUF4136 domain-containing protein [Terrimonas ginsenosidimutans]MCG2615498.1 DUF4136 domain-containing protein [Terrimonas ginsenosidimutans]